jgi:hypothetical protein
MKSGHAMKNTSARKSEQTNSVRKPFEPVHLRKLGDPLSIEQKPGIGATKPCCAKVTNTPKT